MLADNHPENSARLAALREMNVLDTPAEHQFDKLVKLVAEICEVPTALISLVDEGRQFFKARIGVPISETGLEMSVCSHAILNGSTLEITDTDKDIRTADMPKDKYGLDMRFYAGAPIHAENGLPVGSLCVIDNKPRELTDLQRDALRVLGDQVSLQLQMRARLEKEKAEAAEEKQALTDSLTQQKILNQEIDHRVKNSLQLVKSILRFQANATENAEITEALEEAQSRISAIAAVHAELESSDDFSSVNLHSYISNIARDLSATAPDKIKIKCDCDHVVLDSKKATSVAILVNEFIANSVKYAFPDDANGTVTITLTNRGDSLHITMQDDGIGYDGTQANSKAGLGTKIMRAAAIQLSGELDYRSQDRGTCAEIMFAKF